MRRMKYHIKPGSLFKGLLCESDRESVTAEMHAMSLLRIEGDGRGMSVICSVGLICLTQPGDADDHLLREGQTFVVDKKGLIVLTAFADSWINIRTSD